MDFPERASGRCARQITRNRLHFYIRPQDVLPGHDGNRSLRPYSFIGQTLRPSMRGPVMRPGARLHANHAAW
jgi:hypothetical protein